MEGWGISTRRGDENQGRFGSFAVNRTDDCFRFGLFIALLHSMIFLTSSTIVHCSRNHHTNSDGALCIPSCPRLAFISQRKSPNAFAVRCTFDTLGVSLIFFRRYGLLLELLGSSSLGSLWNAGSYLLRGSTKRSRAVSMFREAFVVGIAAYVLTHAVRFVLSVMNYNYY